MTEPEKKSRAEGTKSAYYRYGHVPERRGKARTPRLADFLFVYGFIVSMGLCLGYVVVHTLITLALIPALLAILIMLAALLMLVAGYYLRKALRA